MYFETRRLPPDEAEQIQRAGGIPVAVRFFGADNRTILMSIPGGEPPADWNEPAPGAPTSADIARRHAAVRLLAKLPESLAHEALDANFEPDRQALISATRVLPKNLKKLHPAAGR